MSEMSPTILSSANANNSCWAEVFRCGQPQHSLTDGIMYIINQFICLFGLVGNGTVLWFLRLDIKKNPFIIYICSLVVADYAFLLCSMFVVVVFAVEYFSGCEFINHSQEWRTLMNVIFKLELFSYSSSMYFLTAISTTRCLSALYPFWYHSRCPAWLSRTATAVLWFLGILLNSMNIFSCFLGTIQPHMATVIVALNLFMFAPIMILSSVTLFIKVKYCLQQRQAGHLCTTILLTVLFFVICDIPLSVKFFLKEHACLFPKVFYILASVNSSINPVIYFLVGSRKQKWFKESLQFILQRALKEEKDSTEDGKV